MLITPVRPTVPNVGRNAVTPHLAAGKVIDPAVSEPIANGTIPAINQQFQCMLNPPPPPPPRRLEASGEAPAPSQVYIATIVSSYFRPTWINFLAAPPGAMRPKKKRLPAEVQAAGPADEPVEYSSIFHGFLVRPPNQMSS